MVQLDTNTLLKILNVSNNVLENKVFSGISIDTRSIKENEIFIAIKGKNFNGHHFIEDAFETAIKKAALEAFEGQYSEQELYQKIKVDEVKIQALQAIIDF